MKIFYIQYFKLNLYLQYVDFCFVWQIPKIIDFLYNRGRFHWAMIRIYFPCEEYKHGFVFSIDHAITKDDIKMRNDRAKVAKFFGVYNDIRSKGEAYTGPEDVIASCLPSETYIALKEIYGYSSFPHAHLQDPSSGRQQDAFNCGIIGFMMSLNALNGNYKMLRSSDTKQANCNNFRRGLFTLFRKLVEYFDPDWQTSLKTIRDSQLDYDEVFYNSEKELNEEGLEYNLHQSDLKLQNEINKVIGLPPIMDLKDFLSMAEEKLMKEKKEEAKNEGEEKLIKKTKEEESRSLSNNEEKEKLSEDNKEDDLNPPSEENFDKKKIPIEDEVSKSPASLDVESKNIGKEKLSKDNKDEDLSPPNEENLNKKKIPIQDEVPNKELPVQDDVPNEIDETNKNNNLKSKESKNASAAISTTNETLKTQSIETGKGEENIHLSQSSITKAASSFISNPNLMKIIEEGANIILETSPLLNKELEDTNQEEAKLLEMVVEEINEEENQLSNKTNDEQVLTDVKDNTTTANNSNLNEVSKKPIPTNLEKCFDQLEKSDEVFKNVDKVERDQIDSEGYTEPSLSTATEVQNEVEEQSRAMLKSTNENVGQESAMEIDKNNDESSDESLSSVTEIEDEDGTSSSKTSTKTEVPKINNEEDKEPKPRNKTPFGTFEKQFDASENKNIIEEIATLFTKNFKRNTAQKNFSKYFFYKKMREYETFYITDIYHHDKPSSSNINDKGLEDADRTVVCASIVEITSFVQRIYKHRSTEIAGYRAKSKAIILHYIATDRKNRGRGYARFLLNSIANMYKDNGIYMYCPVITKEKGIFPNKTYDSTQFLQNIGFETDKRKKNFELNIVDHEKKIDEPVTSEENELFRCHTTTLRSLDILSKMYKSAKALQVEKDIVQKVIYTQRVKANVDLDKHIKDHAKKEIIYVSQRKWNEMFFVSNENTFEKRKHNSEISVAEGVWKRMKLDEKNNPTSDTESQDESDSESSNDGRNNIKFMLYGHNAHFGWRALEDGMVHVSLTNLAKENPHKIIKIPAGGRKQTSTEDGSLENTTSLMPIKRIFQITSPQDPFYGSCQWIAAAMLIHIENEDEAQSMMSMLQTCPENYNWKMMYKGKSSLAEMLQKGTKYRLTKVRWEQRGIKPNYIRFLFNEAKGKYVCLLRDNNYAETHVVGVDCSSSPKLIWDCAERNALLLSQSNLDRCTGQNTVCSSITTIGEICIKKDLKKK